MKILVSRIAALRPDLVLISKTVSRIAQEFLVAENIAFALNTKRVIHQRVARATNANILSSATGITLSYLK